MPSLLGIELMSDYLISNSVELVIIGLAFCFSKCKAVPLYIIFYIFAMLFIFAYSGDYVDFMDSIHIDNATYNFNLSLIYMFQGSAMIIIGLTAMFMIQRLAFMLAVLIMSQGVFSLIAGMSIAMSEMYDIDVNFVMDSHGLINGVYVVLYCLLAWICVYYSRTNYEYSRN